MKNRVIAISLAFVMVLSMCIAGVPASNVQAKESIDWERDFEYEIEDNNIVLRRYIGSDEVVNIPATATIDGIRYKVKLNDDSSMFFSEQGDITAISFSKDIDTSNVTNMAAMFWGCSNLQSLDITGFDTSNVNDMSHMFVECINLQSLDVSGFDTRNVTDMSGMFSGCQLQSLDVSGFDTRNVTDMSGMFWGCFNLQSLDVSGFDTRNVTDMSHMFQGCESLTNLDLSKFNTRNVTKMNNMFEWCTSLEQLDLSAFNTNEVTNMEYMFSQCWNLKRINLSSFDTHKTTNMMMMFNGCSSLEDLDLSSFDTGKVTSMYGMFTLIPLESLDLSNFNTSSVVDMSYMFHNCKRLRTIKGIESFDTRKVTHIVGMFKSSNLESIDLSGFDLGNVTNKRTDTDYDHDDSNMFDDCMNLKEIKIPLNLKVEDYLPFEMVEKDNPSEVYNVLPMNQSTSFTLVRKGEEPSENSPVYRFYNPNSGEHLYTTSEADKNDLIRWGWNYEGIAYYDVGSGNGIPVYRSYNPNSGDHIYSSKEEDYQKLPGMGWVNEGVSFYAKTSGDTPVYRFFNPNAEIGTHIYTSNMDDVAKLLEWGWISEGICWYAY